MAPYPQSAVGGFIRSTRRLFTEEQYLVERWEKLKIYLRELLADPGMREGSKN
ncbi:MAG: hypothetical protein QF619_09295 [Candidatus Binatia bacterium]|jgi:hypothetical protein|nr:hypothetical protein [Candidatus Binatia bacterium]